MSARPRIGRMLNLFALGMTISLLTGCDRRAPLYTIVEAQDEQVLIPLPSVNDGGVHFFTFRYQGKNVNFFVRTDGAGNLQAHFDACYSCYKYKLGYVREGDQMVCIACRYEFHLDDVVWDYIGACAPIRLNSTINGESVVIQRSRLVRGSRFF